MSAQNDLEASGSAASAPPPAQTIRTILTHVRPGSQDLPRLRTAASLARRFDATLFGLGCEALPPLGVIDPTGGAQGEWYVAMQDQAELDLQQARKIFDGEVEGLKTHWAKSEDLPAEALARAGRGADLIVAGGRPLDQMDHYRDVDTGVLVLRAGRPVLIAPPAGGQLSARAVVVAWKDTREGRRALFDALPFLCTAETVCVLEVCNRGEAADAEARTAAVVNGLGRHGVKAEARVAVASPERVSDELNATAHAIGADLIVAGGYGRSRMGEWLFGGVTRDLLHYPERFVLLSH